MSLPAATDTWYEDLTLKNSDLWPTGKFGSLHVSALAIVMVLQLAFSYWVVMNKVLTPKIHAKTAWRKNLHVGGALVAFFSAGVTILLFSFNIYVPFLATLAGVTFAINGFIGLCLVPIVPGQWVVWKRLFAIGGLFNVAGGACVWLILYPNYWACLLHKICLGLLFIVCVAEFGLTLTVDYLPNLGQSYFRRGIPSKDKSYAFCFAEFLFARGQLPNRNFFSQILGAETGVLVTIIYALSWWPFLDDWTKYSEYSLETRMSGAALLLVSLWGNSLSTLGPTLLYRATMEMVPAMLMYNLFAFPIPQITGMLILFHPLNFAGANVRPVFGPVLWSTTG